MTLTASRPLSPAYPRELKTLGDHLRKKRLDLGLLQKDVADILGVHQKSVYNWEKNRTSLPVRFIPRIIRFLEYVPYSTSTQSLRERILLFRQIFGLTQENMARRLGVDPTTLRRWEKQGARPIRRYRHKLELLLVAIDGAHTTRS